MKKMLLIFIVMSLHCVRSQQDQCYVDADRTGKGQDCDPVGIALLLGSADSESEKNQAMSFGLLLCLQKYELDRQCGSKSKYIPIPAF